MGCSKGDAGAQPEGSCVSASGFPWLARSCHELTTVLHFRHWVNHLALSTDFVLQTGFFEQTKDKSTLSTVEEKRAKAKERFEKVATTQGKVVERLVSASVRIAQLYLVLQWLTSGLFLARGHLAARG